MAEPSSAKKIENLKAINIEYERQLKNLGAKADAEQRSVVLSQQSANNQKLINELIIEQGTNTSKNAAEIDALLATEKEIAKQQKQINDELKKGVDRRQKQVNIAKELVNQLRLGWKYLQDQDKIIKSTNLNLGMSGTKAEAMRNAFEDSSKYVMRLGGSMADISAVMQGYADETGRARVMTTSMVEDITAISKGTGLSVEEATRLGAQFELMGYDAKGTMDYVQGVVDTSERMGVNTTKVLKVVNDNFKKLNTYTFQQGVKGFAEMAMYAEKFRIDIGQALNAADVARSLEGAIDLAAQLQVMGGEFAKTDPFEMLFLSRNDPAKFTEKIADMTKGVVSFRKVTDSAGKTVFEKFISPADRDRLAAVAEAMGMEASQLTIIAERQAEIQKMRQQTAGLGLSKEQQDLVEGAALFDQKSGKFQVQLGETMFNIGELTEKQANSFVKEQVMLEERAKTAMTFDETFKATIEILKASLLPLLTTINKILDVTVKPLADLAAKGGFGLAGAAGILLTAGLLWKGITNKLGNVATKWVGEGGGKGTLGKVMGGKGGGGGGFKGIQPGAVGSNFTKTGQIRKGAAGLTKAQGTASLKKGLGAGGAMAGAGAGIMLAAKGLAELATAMKDLSPEQAESLEKIAITMAVTFPLAAIGIGLIAKSAEAGALGLLALGAAITLVGAGIYLATSGIGQMGTGLALLNDSGEGAGAKLSGVALGVGAITLAMTAGGGVLGMMAFNRQLKLMNKHSEGVTSVGTAFASIQQVLSGSKDDWIAVQNAVEGIAGANVKGGGFINELRNLLKKPLQVEFAQTGVTLKNNITLDLDGKALFTKSYDSEVAVQKDNAAATNKPV